MNDDNNNSVNHKNETYDCESMFNSHREVTDREELDKLGFSKNVDKVHFHLRKP